MILGHQEQCEVLKYKTVNQHIFDLTPETTTDNYIHLCTNTLATQIQHVTFSCIVCTNLLPTVSTLFIAVKNIAKQDNNLWVLAQSQQHVQHYFPIKLHQYK